MTGGAIAPPSGVEVVHNPHHVGLFYPNGAKMNGSAPAPITPAQRVADRAASSGARVAALTAAGPAVAVRRRDPLRPGRFLDEVPPASDIDIVHNGMLDQPIPAELRAGTKPLPEAAAPGPKQPVRLGPYAQAQKRAGGPLGPTSPVPPLGDNRDWTPRPLVLSTQKPGVTTTLISPAQVIGGGMKPPPARPEAIMSMEAADTLRALIRAEVAAALEARTSGNSGNAGRADTIWQSFVANYVKG